MKVHTATLAGGDNNQDRVFAGENAVIVLDGASAFDPVDVDPGLYAETVGVVIAEQLNTQPRITVASAVATAINHATQQLNLDADRSPSSTVSVLRVRRDSDTIDLYVLGDSPIHYGTQDKAHTLVDNRLAELPIRERIGYEAARRAGHGFTDKHHSVLANLQRAQRTYRNTKHGYWIAETDPEAARHALVAEVPCHSMGWATLATDGAADSLDVFGLHGWCDIAFYDPRQLSELLETLHDWEAHNDPHSQFFPRAKQHDDKTIAAITNFPGNRPI